MPYDVTIMRRPTCARFDIQGKQQAVADWCGTTLPPFPQRPNSLTERDGEALIWAGPGHWHFAAPIDKEAAIEAGLRPGSAPPDVSIVLISDTLTSFTITGPDADEVMAVASPLDLHPRAFPNDGATWTEAMGTKALIRRITAGYEIAVDRSYGDWFEACLRLSSS